MVGINLRWLWILSAILLVTSSVHAGAVAPKANQRQHPTLLVNDSIVKQLRRDIRNNTWKAQHWGRIKAEADKFLAQPVELPPRGGNWDHYYIDSVTGTGLLRQRQIGDWQWEHQNPRTKQVVVSNPRNVAHDYDAVMIGFIHNTWALATIELGLAYQISGDKRYAERGRDILLAYAKLYPSLPTTNLRRDPSNTGLSRGRVHVQSLDEAIWLVNMAQGADLVWTTLTAREQQQLIQSLFLPAAALLDHKYKIDKIHNITCWENAAIGMVGFLANNDSLVTEAFRNPTKGFAAQVKKGITAEGFWTERAPSYHFYALQAMLTLTQAALNRGEPVDIAPFKAMFDVPLKLSDPQLTLPPINDSKRVSLISQDFMYEWAFTHFHDPQYASVLQQRPRGQRLNRGPHFEDWAFLYGQAIIPEATPRQIQSLNLPETGLALLSKGQGKDNTALYAKYTPNKGPHAHPEQLSFVLQKGQEQIAVDPGVATYAHPGHLTWYKTTAAHNTLIVDEAGQRSSATSCLAFGQQKGADYLMAETNNAYDSVRFIRTIALLTDNLVVVVDQVQATRPRKTLDIAYHQTGQWLDLPTSETWQQPHKSGFEYLTNTTIARQQHRVSLSAGLTSGRKVRVTLADNASTDILTATDPFTPENKVSSVFFRRQQTNSAVWAWCISLDNTPVAVRVQALPMQPKSAAAVSALSVQVQTPNHEKWSIIIDADQTYSSATKSASRVTIN